MRTLWTRHVGSAMQLPAWRNRRISGGGVLSEIAVHHIDLVRYLMKADVNEVFAQSQHGELDDQASTLLLQLSNGATVSSIFSEASNDANEIELIGSKGRLVFSLYRFDSLQFTPAGRYGESRAAQIFNTLKQLR